SNLNTPATSPPMMSLIPSSAMSRYIFAPSANENRHHDIRRAPGLPSVAYLLRNGAIQVFCLSRIFNLNAHEAPLNMLSRIKGRGVVGSAFTLLCAKGFDHQQCSVQGGMRAAQGPGLSGDGGERNPRLVLSGNRFSVRGNFPSILPHDADLNTCARHGGVTDPADACHEFCAASPWSGAPIQSISICTLWSIAAI